MSNVSMEQMRARIEAWLDELERMDTEEHGPTRAPWIIEEGRRGRHPSGELISVTVLGHDKERKIIYPALNCSVPGYWRTLPNIKFAVHLRNANPGRIAYLRKRYEGAVAKLLAPDRRVDIQRIVEANGASSAMPLTDAVFVLTCDQAAAAEIADLYALALAETTPAEEAK